MFSLISDTGDSEEKNNPSSPNRSGTYDLLVSSPDALPLSYRRLMGAKIIKLGPCDKHPAYCLGCIFAIIYIYIYICDGEF